MNRFVLVLVSLNDDRTDLSGNIYNTSGHIEANCYRKDAKIDNGLYGILCGKMESNKWLHTGEQYVVVKTMQNDEIILLDRYEHLVKFHSAVIVFSGLKQDAMTYIHDNLTPDQEDDILKQYSPRQKLIPESDNSPVIEVMPLLVA